MTLKIFEETCVHRNTVPTMCARTWAIIRWGFSLEKEARHANGDAGVSLGFKYSLRIKNLGFPMRSACWVLGALTPGSVARPLHPEPHARVMRKNPPLTTQNPPLLGFNFFLNFLLAQRSFSFLYFRSWRCFLQTAYI